MKTPTVTIHDWSAQGRNADNGEPLADGTFVRFHLSEEYYIDAYIVTDDYRPALLIRSSGRFYRPLLVEPKANNTVYVVGGLRPGESMPTIDTGVQRG